VVVTNAPSVVKAISIKPTVITADNKPVVVTQNDPPPLAPLSAQSNKIITINPNSQDGKVLVSPKLSANKMLVDLLDKKASEPQFVTIKRKADPDLEVPAKKIELEATSGDPPVTPSPKAADLYAKLAGSILEDEDMEEDDEDEIEKAVPAKIIEKKIIEVKPTGGGSQIISSNPRQIIMGPNNQVILSPNATHQTTATIKTDSGIQSVPIIIQQPTPTIIQQPAPTQYILATNQQGQTYVVAQQPIAQPQVPQQFLLAQTPGQQGQKTIIILQQPGGQHGQAIQVAQPSQQKIIMTPSGQQVIYSSPMQRQVVGQQTVHTPPPGTSIIQNSPGAQAGNRKIVITNAAVDSNRQPQQTTTKIVQHATSQQIQAMAQGQNIIMQKGQQYKIGSTQITQIVNQPQVIQQQQAIVTQQQPQQVTQTITQKIVTAKTDTQVVPQTIGLTTIVKQAAESPAGENSITPPETPKEQKSEEKEEEMKTEEAATPASQTSSGTSSPAPPNKQTISIQIPVPQSQIAGPNAQQYTIKIIPSMDPSVKVKDEDVEISWPYTCEVSELLPRRFVA
jgi:AT-rich interactive domain-containing protein 2